jgi:hypothetical protein
VKERYTDRWIDTRINSSDYRVASAKKKCEMNQWNCKLKFLMIEISRDV